MTPADAIAMLDRQLAAHGQGVILRKTNSATGQITVRGFVRGYKPDEVVGIITASDFKVTISATGLEAFGVPPINGQALFNGDGPRSIKGAAPTYVAGQLVRVDLTVKG